MPRTVQAIVERKTHEPGDNPAWKPMMEQGSETQQIRESGYGRRLLKPGTMRTSVSSRLTK